MRFMSLTSLAVPRRAHERTPCPWGGGVDASAARRPPAALEQPIGEVAARAQFRDRHLKGADAGVGLPGPVAVAAVRAGLAALTPVGTADGVGLGGHKRVDECRKHLPQQIRTGLSQLLVQEGSGLDTAGCGHRVEFLKYCEESPEDHAVAASTFRARYSPGRRTPPWRTPLDPGIMRYFRAPFRPA